ncbi:MAG: 23S rRNA (uracil(1939)-C(5))-methyltransferase RlmD [Candidatus Cloacimonetes bacterium]|nr:23S rRNA (uracil(1939)-C(5))-methyltransferase RlmD [Candidatus Cloacimonadota bacterium]
MRNSTLKLSPKSIINSLKIEKIVSQGHGLAYADGKPVFVQSGLTGDVVDLEVIHETGKAIFGRILAYHQHSEFYSEPKCEVFGICGGCDWLNMKYSRQLLVKEQLLRDTFSQLTENCDIFHNICASPQEDHYRNKVFLPVSKKKKDILFGMFARKTHEVIPHQNCRLHKTILENIADDIINYVRKSNLEIYNELNQTGNLRHIGFRVVEKSGEIVVVLVTKNSKLPFSKQLVRSLTDKYPQVVGIIQNINPKQTNRITGDDSKIIFGRPFLYDSIGEIKLKLHYLSFFQINNLLTECLYQEIEDNIFSGDSVIDAFSGVGTIGLFIAKKANQVVFIESNTQACSDAEDNIKLNNQTNCTVINGKVEEQIQALIKEQNFNTVIFDPPRKGLDSKTIKAITESGIQKIIYVSCNPATQVRDLKEFLNSGYKLTKVRPFDMFPHTHHLENLAILQKK